MDKCPHCGSCFGYYTISVQRLKQYTDFDGNAIDGIHDYIRGGKQKYCGACDKKIVEKKTKPTHLQEI